MFIKIASKLL